MPFVAASGELKTKPTQHSVKELRSIGIQPDLLLIRCDRKISSEERKKIALFCNLNENAVIPALDVKSIYEVPIKYHEEGLDNQILKIFDIKSPNEPNLNIWHDIVNRVTKPEGKVKIAIVGKYTSLLDAYKSLVEAVSHGGFANNVSVEISWIDSSLFESENVASYLDGVHGILVPGAFGERGAEGMIKAIQYSREKKIPYFGICFGMQMAVVETARNLAGLNNASSSEFGKCEHPVVGLLKEWMKDDIIYEMGMDYDMGGTMRLGAFDCKLLSGTKANKIYNSSTISERHRHRYEVNINYKDILEKVGLNFSGMSPNGALPEIVELTDHPWFLGVQFHPELKSKPFDPHPLFKSFIEATIKYSRLV